MARKANPIDPDSAEADHRPSRSRGFSTHADTESWDTSFCRYFLRVSDGTRTHDRLDHNQELYQLSYAHQGEGI